MNFDELPNSCLHCKFNQNKYCSLKMFLNLENTFVQNNREKIDKECPLLNSNFDNEKKRVEQCYEDSGNVWCYYDGEHGNPCGCGSNCYHYEYDGENIYGVCNGCQTDIYEMKPEYVEEKLKQGIWK